MKSKMDEFKSKRGIVGHYNNIEVNICELTDYIRLKEIDKDIYYIIADDDYKVIYQGQMVGYLQDGGTILPMRLGAYKAELKQAIRQEKVKPQKEKKEEEKAFLSSQEVEDLLSSSFGKMDLGELDIDLNKLGL